MPLNLLKLPLELSDLIFSYVLPFNIIHINSTEEPYIGNDPYIAQSWFTGVTTLRPIATLRDRECIEPWVLEPPHHGSYHLKTSLLLVCKRIHEQAARILYSRNTFDFGCSWPDTVHGADFAAQLLGRMRPTDRNWIRSLSLDSIVMNRLSFGLPLGDQLVALDWHDYGSNPFERASSFAVRLGPALEAFCEIIGKMGGLRELAIGIVIDADIPEWDKKLESVPAVMPLLNMFADDGVKAKIFIWRVEKWDRWTMDDAKEAGDTFVRMLAEGLRRRRVLVDGAEAARMVVYLEPEIPVANARQTVQYDSTSEDST